MMCRTTVRYRELGRSRLSPAVSTVIPGMRTERNVERNTAMSDGRLLTSDQLTLLAKHRRQRNFSA
ncbi:hypothetical protein [Streptomyces scopuliridis]|uniref:hypothetical protein n=1 Tax=Streptomyces scopuliridis TaxID=452529 RepID=UPI0036834CED